MTAKRHMIRMMADALPRCPICGSNIGYETVSVLKGVVRCKACRTEWSSRDFFRSDRLRSLVLRELPEGRHTLACGEYTLRRYEEYPIEFWRSLAKISRQSLSIEYRGIIRVSLLSVLIFLAAFIPRFLLIDETSIMTDEPLYVSAGRLYVRGFLSLNFGAEVWQLNAEHPPIAKLLIGASSYIFAPLIGGESVHNMYFAARLAPVAAGTLICILIYLIGRRHYNEDAALLGAFLAAFSPWLTYYSTLAILDIFAALFLTITFLLLPLVKGINRYLVLVGIFSGLALGSKGTAISVFPGIALYLFLRILVGESKEGVRGLRMIMLQFLLILIIAALTFFLTWPWLWQDTISRAFWVLGFHIRHMESGHATFYAGRVYIHVPQWVTIFVLFVKTPILIFALGILSLIYIVAKIFRRQTLKEGYISVLSWLIGGLLTMLAFRILIGDHYVVFLEPAIILLASLFAADFLKNVRGKIAKFKLGGKTAIFIILASLTVLESLIGLFSCWASPCGYSNELINRADKALLIIDTGFEDAAEYLINNRDKNAIIAAAYSTSLLQIELNRKGEMRFKIVDLKRLGEADYAVFPSIYTQRYGFPQEIRNWTLIHEVKSGGTTLCYIFRAPKRE